MSGKILGIAIIVTALLFGAGVYYFQVFHYYERVEDDAGQVFLTPLDGGAPEHIPYGDFEGIDATSSPIRFRGCFTTPERPQALDARFERGGVLVEGGAAAAAPIAMEAGALAARLLALARPPVVAVVLVRVLAAAPQVRRAAARVVLEARALAAVDAAAHLAGRRGLARLVPRVAAP